MDVERFTLGEFQSRLHGQGVTSLDHAAVVCPKCGKTQSRASLIRAGLPPAQVVEVLGYRCEGYLSGLGSWPDRADQSLRAALRRTRHGCDYAMVSLSDSHQVEVITVDDGQELSRATFRPAHPAEARALEQSFSDRPQ